MVNGNLMKSTKWSHGQISRAAQQREYRNVTLVVWASSANANLSDADSSGHDERRWKFQGEKWDQIPSMKGRALLLRRCPESGDEQSPPPAMRDTDRQLSGPPEVRGTDFGQSTAGSTGKSCSRKSALSIIRGRCICMGSRGRAPSFLK